MVLVKKQKYFLGTEQSVLTLSCAEIFQCQKTLSIARTSSCTERLHLKGDRNV